SSSGGEADLDVHAGRKMVESLERVDGLGRRLVDVDQTLVGADLEVLTGILVLEWRPDHAVHVLLRRQRHRAGNGRAVARRRLDGPLGRRLDRRVVIGLQANADLVLSDCCHGLLLELSVSHLTRPVPDHPGGRCLSYLTWQKKAAGSAEPAAHCNY